MGRHFPARCLLSDLTHSRLAPSSTHQKPTETTTIIQPPPLFSYVVANNCVAHFNFFPLASCDFPTSRHLRPQRLYGLEPSLCSEPIYVDFAGLDTTKWHRKSVITRFRELGPHRQLQGTVMADPNQPLYHRRCRVLKALPTIATSHFLHWWELCPLLIMQRGGIAPIRRLALLLLIPLHPHL
jgi:hypothetical protein